MTAAPHNGSVLPRISTVGSGKQAHSDDQEAKPLLHDGGKDHEHNSEPSKLPATTWQRWMQTMADLTANSGSMRVAFAIVVSVTWMTISSGLILVNKYILSDLHFPYPMTVSSMGMFTSGVFAWLSCRPLGLVEAQAVVTPRFYATHMMPVGLLMALTLWTGNNVYLYLTVSFIQMLKAFTPVMTMVALFLARLETPNKHMIASVLLIALGTVLSAYGEVNMSAVGLANMFTSEATESARLVMTQYLLTGLKFGPFEGVMYLAPACFLWLALGSALLEWPKIAATGGVGIIMDHLPLFILAACMGFGVNVLAYATIKLASSLTLKVLGTVKNALLILAAVAMFGDVVTPLQGVGYVVSVAAFVVYTHVKMKQIASS